MKRRIWLIVLAVAVLFAIGGAALALTVSPSVNLTATELDVEHDNPGVYGSYVVWDTHEDDMGDNFSDIILYNLADPTSGPVAITDDEDSYAPNIDDDRIVYTHDDGEDGYSVRMHTISNPAASDEILASGLSGWELFPDISGNNVVYRAWDEDQSIDVIMYLNLADEAPTPVRISPDGVQCGVPAVSGDYVVFEGDDGSYDKIYLNNVTQFATDAIVITPDDSNDYEWPNIDGKTVVYENDDDAIVYAYNIDSTATRQISLDGENADEPDIQGNNIVYSSAADGDPDEWITFFNLVTGAHTPVSDPDNYCCPDSPAVYGNSVLYLDHWDQPDPGSEDYYDGVYYVKVSPTFDTVPGLTNPINIDEGQTIWQNPYIIKVFPTGGTEIVRVEFYIDGVLIGTIYAPNADGVWECPWDTSLYHSLVRVVAYDAAGDSVEITRNTTVSLPYTGR